jgi:hypothetical protein
LSFLDRSASPALHAAIVDHLGNCRPCRELVAVALLAHEDPLAAAELAIERQGRTPPRHLRLLPWLATAAAISVIALSAIYIGQADTRPGWLQFLLGDDQQSAADASDSQRGAPNNSWFGGSRQSAESKEQKAAPGWDSGPAPQAGHVESIRSVELPPARTDAAANKPAPEPAATQPAQSSFPPAEIQQRSQRRLVIDGNGHLLRTVDGGAHWDRALAVADTQFRSIAVAGTVIWAAGTGGALYRSHDVTVHWERVRLMAGTVPVTAELGRLRFTDAFHGSVSAITGETWVTNDSGQTWSKGSTARATRK